MTRSLLISVRFHDGCYHGERSRGIGEWPPVPARLFQALVAGTAKAAEMAGEDIAALKWLQELEAPIIATPDVRKVQSFSNFVPNNDLDKFGGDPRKTNKIRTSKKICPHIFNPDVPLLFVWAYNGDVSDECHARTICRIAEHLYQLGRGVDMAWAWAELLNAGEVEARLMRHGGVVYRPSKGATGKALACPREGSFASLKERYEANRKRFAYVKQGRTVQPLFSQPPKPRFARIMYDSPPSRFLYEMRAATLDESFITQSSVKAVELVKFLRDEAVSRLKKALPGEVGKIDRALIGREATEADKAARVRIVPLPSIGYELADHAIRRVLVEIPSNCPLRSDDIAWAFSGLERFDQTTGEIKWNLIRGEERGMLRHYGMNENSQDNLRIWRTITPAALPVSRSGRRSAGSKRVADENKASHAVMQALRHIGITTPLETVRIQREPFDRNGAKAEEFAVPERFAARVLRHVEITFAQAVCGPLVIGNGRYLGLGLMAPVKNASDDVLCFPISATAHLSIYDAKPLLRATRRALMSLSKGDTNQVPELFSGHKSNGAPAGSGQHEHIFLAVDDTDGTGYLDRLIVAAPWACDRAAKANRGKRASFDRVARKLKLIRAGKLGAITLGPADAPPAGDSLIGPAQVWESCSRYCPTRHAGRRKDTRTAVSADVITECERRGLPKPEVEILELSAGPNGGNLTAHIRLHFKTAVKGPLMLGRDSHEGGGLFTAMNS